MRRGTWVVCAKVMGSVCCLRESIGFAKYLGPNNAEKIQEREATAIINAHNEMQHLFEPKPATQGMTWPFIYPLTDNKQYQYSFAQLEKDILPTPDASRY